MARITKRKGSQPKLRVYITDPDSIIIPTYNGFTLVDPTELVLTLQAPDSTISTFTEGVDEEIVRTSVGAYYFLLDLDQAGTYHWSWRASINGVGAAVVSDQLDSVEDLV